MDFCLPSRLRPGLFARKPWVAALGGLSIVACTSLTTAPAHAAESTRGPLYVEVSAGWGTIAYGCITTPTGACAAVDTQGAPRLSAEIGYHLNGRHEGPFVAARQTFLQWYIVANLSQAKVGWDFAFPAHGLELTVSPYAAAGLGYEDQGRPAMFAFGIGVEGKFFFWRGLYGYLVPLEVGAWLARRDPSWAQYQTGTGIGFAF